MIINRIAWNKQPQYLAGIDKSHPLASSIKYLRTTLPFVGSHESDVRGVLAGPGGVGVNLTGGTAATSTTESGLPGGAASPFTMEVLLSCTSAPSLSHFLSFGEPPSGTVLGTKRGLLSYPATPLNIYFWGDDADADSGIPWNRSGLLQHVIVTWAGSGNIFFYSKVSGEISTSNVALTNALTATQDQKVYLGGMHPSGTIEPTATIYKRAVYDRFLRDKEARDLLDSPWRIFQPQTRVVSAVQSDITLQWTVTSGDSTPTVTISPILGYSGINNLTGYVSINTLTGYVSVIKIQ